MSNFPLAYQLSWLPRLMMPSLTGGPAVAPRIGQFPAETPVKTVRLVFLGDISAVANRAAPVIDGALREIIGSADLVVANCESPLVEQPYFPLPTRFGLRHAMTPAFLDRLVAAAGIDPGKLVLSLANNHALDQGPAGFDETVAALASRGIRVIGTQGGGAAEGIRVGPLMAAFLAFTQWRNGSEADFAGRGTMLDDIAEPAPQAGVDLLVAVPHWDWEFRHFPRPETPRLAQRLAGSGAGLIVGGHAHVVQPVDLLGGALVAYGLGDFLGTAMARQSWPGRIGIMLAVDVSADPGTRGRVAGYEVIPFLRQRQGDRERLVPTAALDGRLKRLVTSRLALIYGA